MSTTARGRRSTRAQLVEHAVLRHLEEPRRELRAEREARQALEDAEEDLLRQVLGERPVADQPQHVVEDRHLVGAHDDREGALITTLCLPQDAEIRLWQRQGDLIIPGLFEQSMRFSPVICKGWAKPSRARTVGARSDSSPRSLSLSPFSVRIKGTRFVVWAVCGLTPSASSICSALPWSAVTRQTPPSAVHRLDDAAEAGVGRLDRLHDRRDHAGVADHVRVREVDDRERVAVADLLDEASVSSTADISGLWS